MTPTEFRTVRIFLSSTFRDFALERDLLVRKIFPELRRKCRERQVTLVDVDLRWGITEQEAQQGKVLPICLAEIDRARPYFIGFLGERYGWVPQETQYDLSLLVEQPWLEEHRGGKSVTELEILHGVLNNPKMAGRAFFYFRDPEWSTRQGGVDASEGAAEKGRLEALKGRIRRSGFPVVEDYPDPEALAERVREDLWRLIDETYPADAVPDALTRERTMHEAYGATRQRLYLGGEEYFKALDQAMRAEKFSPVLINGQSGGGKSSLLANWVTRWRAEHPENAVIQHHLGCGADAADPVRLAMRLMQEIARLTREEFKPESDPERQLEQLPQWLALGSSWAEREGRELLLVLDGLDKVLDRKDLRWFPSFLPSGVKLVASCLEGAILQAAKGRLGWRELEVKPFSQADQVHFIGEYLGRYRKSLTAQQTRTLQGHPLSGNPLFLLTVLEELRVFGVHEELDQRLDTLLSPPPSKGEGEAPTVDDVFEHVLARIEADLGEKVVQAAAEAIWASRGGLLREELLGVAQLTPAAWASLQNALDEGLYESRGRISFGHDYLRKAVEDRYDLTGERKLNVHRRLADHFAGLPVDARVAEELPWQWEQAGEQEKLKACLTDRALFLALKERDEYELLGYWVRLGANINAAYEAAWGRWGLERQELESTAGSLAVFLTTAGCYTTFALGLLEEVLRLSRAKLGREHPDTLRAMGNLASSYKAADRLEDGLSWIDGMYVLSRDSLGSRHPTTLAAMELLAGFYDTKSSGTDDWLETSIGLKENVLRLRRETLGPEHLDTLTAMGNLANSYGQSGRLKEALGMREEVLRLMREKLGADHPDTLTAMQNLAISYSDTGRLEEALGMCEEVLRLRREKLGANHPDTLTAMGNLASSYSDTGRLEEALGMREEVLRLRREKLGANHPDTLSAMNDLTISYMAAGRWEEMLRLEEEKGRLNSLFAGGQISLSPRGTADSMINEDPIKLYHSHRENLGAGHSETLAAMVSLIDYFLSNDEKEKASQLIDELTKIMRESEGVKGLQTLNQIGKILEDLIFDHRCRGFKENIFQLQQEALRLIRENYDPDTTNALEFKITAINNLAVSCSKLDRPKEALLLFEKVLQLTREKLGVENSATQSAMKNLAISCVKSGRVDEAIELVDELLKLIKTPRCSENPDALSGRLKAILETVVCLSDAGCLDEAAALSEEILRLSRERLGSEHQTSLSAIEELSDLYLKSNNIENEIKLREEFLRIKRIEFSNQTDELSEVFPEISRSNNKLAICYLRTGRLNEAVELEEEALKFMSRGGFDCYPISTFQRLAAYYSESLDEAQVIFEKAVLTRREKLGFDHTETLNITEILAEIFSKSGRMNEAVGLREEILKRRSEKIGGEDVDTIRVMGQLADSYKEFGWFNKALALEEKMLRAVRLLLEQAEEVAPFYLPTMVKLGISYSRMGRLEEALKVQEQEYQTLAFDLDLSPDHPSFLNTMQRLAISYSKLGRPEDAIRLLKIVSNRSGGRLDAMLGSKEEKLRLSREQLGPEHPDTLGAMHNLAISYRHAGRLEEALGLFEESLRLRREQLGPEHPNTLEAMNNLAVLLNDLGRLPDALLLLRRASTESPVLHAAVRYKLACYECLSGNLEEAKRLITEEIAADPEKQERALQDSDLKAVKAAMMLMPVMGQGTGLAGFRPDGHP